MQLCLQQKIPPRKAMKAALAKKPLIRIAVVETVPLRLVGFLAVYHSERVFEVIFSSLPDVGTLQNVDLVLVGGHSSQNLFDVMAALKATRPNLRIIVIGSGMEDETIFKAISFGPRATWTHLHRPLISCRRYGSSAKARSGLHAESFPCSLNA
jgi:DNA-binding NarL/FixJ family response regulator